MSIPAASCHQDTGTLSFDDKANKYLDWWSKDPNDPRSNITLRHLLTFQSGHDGTATSGSPSIAASWSKLGLHSIRGVCTKLCHVLAYDGHH